MKVFEIQAVLDDGTRVCEPYNAVDLSVVSGIVDDRTFRVLEDYPGRKVLRVEIFELVLVDTRCVSSGKV